MSLISMNAPTVQANADDLQNLVHFIFMQERRLNEFGAIKIKQQGECRHALKERRTDALSCSGVQQVVRVSNDEPIYSVYTAACINGLACHQSLPTDETTFWSSLSCPVDGRRR